ncbi:MAG TPA: hypothetical protein VFR10_01410, partial [bacterium]|nr:hypothetical protein [bacterium]
MMSRAQRRSHPAGNFSLASAIAFAVALLGLPSRAPAGALDRIEDDLQRAFADFPRSTVPSGILLDRVVPIARPQRFDGSEAAPAATPAVLREILFELRRAADVTPAGPSADDLRERG